MALERSHSKKKGGRPYHLYVQLITGDEWEVGHWAHDHLRGQGIINKIVRALDEI